MYVILRQKFGWLLIFLEFIAVFGHGGRGGGDGKSPKKHKKYFRKKLLIHKLQLEV
jgi:hypothetical protein